MEALQDLSGAFDSLLSGYRFACLEYVVNLFLSNLQGKAPQSFPGQSPLSEPFGKSNT